MTVWKEAVWRLAVILLAATGFVLLLQLGPSEAVAVPRGLGTATVNGADYHYDGVMATPSVAMLGVHEAGLPVPRVLDLGRYIYDASANFYATNGLPEALTTGRNARAGTDVNLPGFRGGLVYWVTAWSAVTC